MKGQKSAANAAISMIGLSSQQIASFVITLLAAGFLTPTEYGVYTLAIVFVEFVIALTYTGYFHFLINSKEDDDTVLSTMFWMMVGIGTLGGTALFIGAPFIAQIFDAPELAPMLRWFGLLQPFASIIGWASAALNRGQLMRRYFMILAASNIGGLIVGCVVLILWQSLFALIVYRAMRIALGLVMFAMAVPSWPRLRFSTDMAKRATRYAGGLYGSRMLNFFSQFGTDLVLAFLFSTAEAGLYRFANRLAAATVDIIAQPLRSYALNRFGHAARNERPLDPIYARFLGAMVFLMGGFAVTIVVLGGPIVETLFQPEYLAALGALYALAFRAAALSNNHLIEPVFAARHNTKVGMYHNLFWTSIMVASIVLFSPLGFEKLAAAQAVITLFTSGAAVYVIHRWGKIEVSGAMRNAGVALIILAVYGALLTIGWQVISTNMGTTATTLGLGFGFALLLAPPTIFAAIKLKVLDLSIFAS